MAEQIYSDIFTHHRLGPFFYDCLLSDEASQTVDNTFWDADLTVLWHVYACVWADHDLHPALYNAEELVVCLVPMRGDEKCFLHSGNVHSREERFVSQESLSWDMKVGFLFHEVELTIVAASPNLRVGESSLELCSDMVTVKTILGSRTLPRKDGSIYTLYSHGSMNIIV